MKTSTVLLLYIISKLDTIMTKQEQFEAVITRIDEATTKEAETLRQLKEQIKNQGLPADVEDAILTKLDATATRLEGIGADPENPVPDQPPVEEPSAEEPSAEEPPAE